MAQLTLVRNKTEMSATAAERITSLIERAIVSRSAAALSLTGGRTPDQLYEFLADPDRPWRARIDWARVHLFWTDERNVPPDHPDSNFGLANRTLIQHVPLAASHVHRMRGELQAVDAGYEYDVMLRARRNEIPGPLFDVVLLGIGADAHIASIFPGSPPLVRGPRGSAPQVQLDLSGSVLDSSGTVLDSSGTVLDSSGTVLDSSGTVLDSSGTVLDSSGAVLDSSGAVLDSSGADLSGPRALAAGVWVPKLNQWRITLTPPALLDSDRIVVIAAGHDKADAIATAIEGELDVSRHPAQLLRVAGDRVESIADEAAGARMSFARARRSDPADGL